MACKVLVVCGSPVLASADLLRKLAGECDHVVAVDRGLDALLGAGLSCDVYVGDADTVSDEGRALVDAAADFEVERHNPYKDYTIWHWHSILSAAVGRAPKWLRPAPPAAARTCLCLC